MSAQQNESNTANDVQQPTLDDLRYSQPEGKMRAIPIHYEVLLSRYALDFSQIDPELVREVCEELERIACDYFNDEVSGEFEQTIEDHYDAFARACINYLDSKFTYNPPPFFSFLLLSVSPQIDMKLT